MPIFLVFLLIDIIFASNLKAIPAFARKYQSSCTTCHNAYPSLNEFGYRFKENGYQMVGQEDGDETEKINLEDGLALEKTIYPISLRIMGDINSLPQQPAGLGQNEKARLQFSFPDTISLYLGGTLFKNISFWGNYITNKNEFDQIHIGIHNLLSEIVGEGSLNLRIGFLNIHDWTIPNHRRVLQKKASIQTISTANPEWNLDKAERGIEVYGRPNAGIPFFYYAGITNGGKEIADDTNPAKNYYGGIAFDYIKQHIGIWMYTGRNAQMNTIYENSFNRFGIDGALRFLNTEIYGQAIWGNDKNPDFVINSSVKRQNGYFLGLNYLLFPTTFVLLHYDYSYIKEDASKKVSTFTHGLAFYFIKNARSVIEYQIDLMDRDTNNHPLKTDRFNIRIDTVF